MPGDVAVAEDAEAAGEELLRSPSRSRHWLARNRTMAWRDGQPHGRGGLAFAVIVSSSRRAVGGRRPGGPGAADPAVRGVVADQPGALGAGAGHHVEVVQVVAGRGHRRAVPAVRHEHDVAGADLGEHVDRPVGGAVDPLVADGIARPSGSAAGRLTSK